MRLFRSAIFLAFLGCATIAAAQSGSPGDSLVAINLKQINTPADEYGPLLTNDGSTLYFTREIELFVAHSSSHRQVQDKLFQSSVNADGSFSEPTEVKRFSKLGNFSGVTTDNAGELFLCYQPQGRDALDICQLKGNDLIPLDSVNSKYWDAQPCISADGHWLFFASNRDQTSKWTKIFVSHRAELNGTWSSPTRLGPEVNMGEFNAFPFLSRDSKILFFCSNPDHHDMRIYACFRNDETYTSWSNAVLLPTPINDARRSTFPVLSASGKEFFFVSNRGGIGDWKGDIYQVHLPHGIESLLGKH